MCLSSHFNSYADITHHNVLLCVPILFQILPLLNKCFKHSLALSQTTLDIINTSPMPSNVFIKFSNWVFFKSAWIYYLETEQDS